jgi:hypothetical protein
LFNAPDHIQSAEFVLTQMVHSRWTIAGQPWPGQQNDPTRLIFRKTPDQRVGGSEVAPYITYPTASDSARWNQLVSTIRVKFADVPHEEAARDVAEALEEELSGLRVKATRSIPASPLSPAVAMLQTPKGLARKSNPVAFNTILENMYALGGGVVGDVSKRYSDALEHLGRVDKYVERVAEVVQDGILPSMPRIVSPSSHRASSLGEIHDSPFSWFKSAWDRITSPPWIEALPARRWIDWCGAVIRLAYGMGVLWEAQWYVAIAEALRTGDDVSVTTVAKKCSVAKTLPWRTGPDASGNDVWRTYRKMNVTAVCVREFLENRVVSGLPFQTVVDKSSRSGRVQEAVAELLGEIEHRLSRVNDLSASAKDRIDAIQSALKERSIAEGDPDVYYLLRETGQRRSKSIFVDPSIEVAAVIASLECKEPGGMTTVRDVANALRQLGVLHDNLEADLVRVLERAGLCRRAHDADGSVEVSCAFGAKGAV